MARKDNKYFDAFQEMASYACDASSYLLDIVTEFNPRDIELQLERMHSIEHDGDVARHAMVNMLVKEFITPIDREDIMELSELIDDVTDKIEDVLQRMFMYGVTSMRDDVVGMIKLMVRCTAALKDAIEELPNFKRTKILDEKLIEINRLEEEGDRLYIFGVRNVFQDKSIPPTHTYAWEHIYNKIEHVFDACEDVADVIHSVVLKNS
ncbi:MAG: DUF47 family protein [Clostridiales Family XIII bacterium]|jgi:predicted phosphate transport protein (TIGR00153 family)|nr:DUF47 family protein [Clostridiales Family XIII bacterium]